MTISAGIKGLILFGSPPSDFIASRIAARSTTQGTPVKSCMTTRAGMNGISWVDGVFGSQFSSASTKPGVRARIQPQTFDVELPIANWPPWLRVIVGVPEAGAH